jgi:hypothetical protein
VFLYISLSFSCIPAVLTLIPFCRYAVTCDPKLLPRCKQDICSSGVLRIRAKISRTDVLQYWIVKERQYGTAIVEGIHNKMADMSTRSCNRPTLCLLLNKFLTRVSFVFFFFFLPGKATVGTDFICSNCCDMKNLRSAHTVCSCIPHESYNKWPFYLATGPVIVLYILTL